MDAKALAIGALVGVTLSVGFYEGRRLVTNTLEALSAASQLAGAAEVAPPRAATLPAPAAAAATERGAHPRLPPGATAAAPQAGVTAGGDRANRIRRVGSRLSSEEKVKLKQRWEGMSREERVAMKADIQERRRERRAARAAGEPRPEGSPPRAALLQELGSERGTRGGPDGRLARPDPGDQPVDLPGQGRPRPEVLGDTGLLLGLDD